VVTGPGGAGTTTFVATLARPAVVSTGRNGIGDAVTMRSAAPVSMDFARLVVDRDLVLHLLGTVGPPPAPVRPFLSECLLGRVLFIDASREGAVADAHPLLEWFQAEPAVPYVVGVTKAWSHHDAAVDKVLRQMSVPTDVPVAAVDVGRADSARSLLLALLHRVLAHLGAGDTGEAVGASQAVGVEGSA